MRVASIELLKLSIMTHIKYKFRVSRSRVIVAVNFPTSHNNILKDKFHKTSLEALIQD
jgi:hypothetical protein